MSFQHLSSYVTYLPIFRVIVCHFCKSCIPPNDPLRHYELNHTATKAHHIPMEIRLKIRDYMTTLDLCEPSDVISSNRLIPLLKVISKGFKCNFTGCEACRTSESSMRTHYYTHQEHIPKGFKNWESTALQTFFDGQHKKYIKLFISALMIDISQ
jgi:hypothetical protein